MRSTLQRAMELAAHHPIPIWVSLKKHTKQRGFLLPNPSIPMADISSVVNESRIAAILPSLVLLLDRSEVPIVVYRVGKDEVTGSGIIFEVCRCL